MNTDGQTEWYERDGEEARTQREALHSQAMRSMQVEYREYNPYLYTQEERKLMRKFTNRTHNRIWWWILKLRLKLWWRELINLVRQ
jgi:hypothetical protein